MIPKADKIALSIMALIAIVAFTFKKEIKAIAGSKSSAAQVVEKKTKTKDNTKAQKGASGSATTVTMAQKWEMPAKLKEISGLAFIDEGRFACVQDEEGKIFIYNTASSAIEKEIPFGSTGDYEGIALAGTTAYIMRADGVIFEVSNYDTKPKVAQYRTHLTEKHDVEGICYDAGNDRLLMSIKGKEPNTDAYKGIYAFNLKTKRSIQKPVLKIDLTHQIWKEVKGKQKIEPSDLAIHPGSGDLYIIEGAKPKLLVMSTDGTKRSLHQLNETDFPQPEGITFSPSGEMFISSEGKNGAGVIAKVSVPPTL